MLGGRVGEAGWHTFSHAPSAQASAAVDASDAATDPPPSCASPGELGMKTFVASGAPPSAGLVVVAKGSVQEAAPAERRTAAAVKVDEQF
jgi:hypothetical protein